MWHCTYLAKGGLHRDSRALGGYVVFHHRGWFRFQGSAFPYRENSKFNDQSERGMEKLDSRKVRSPSPRSGTHTTNCGLVCRAPPLPVRQPSLLLQRKCNPIPITHTSRAVPRSARPPLVPVATNDCQGRHLVAAGLLLAVPLLGMLLVELVGIVAVDVPVTRPGHRVDRALALLEP